VAPGVLAAISTSHVVNDMMQSLILAIYPVIKGGFNLSFTQIGLITLTYQLTASIFQPLVGMATDRRPAPYSLPIGMASTLCGMLLLGFAPIRGGADGCGDGRHWFGHLPSGSLAHRAAGLGWPPWLRAVGVPGRRQFRYRARPADCCSRDRAVWPACRVVVCRRRADRHRC
jgi:MFS family permease